MHLAPIFVLAPEELSKKIESGFFVKRFFVAQFNPYGMKFAILDGNMTTAKQYNSSTSNVLELVLQYSTGTGTAVQLVLQYNNSTM